MKEKVIETIIHGITQQYGYLLEDIRSLDGSDLLWTVSKNISGTSYRLIFIRLQRIQELKKYDIPGDKDNIYILFAEDDFSEEKEQEALSIYNLSGKPYIRVEIEEKKVTYSENVNMQVVQELASVMSNNNLQSRGERISFSDKPWITIGIIAINVLMYLVTAYFSFVYAKGSIFNSDTNVLILLGAKVNELIAKGQYYRLISCMFLHG